MILAKTLVAGPLWLETDRHSADGGWEDIPAPLASRVEAAYQRQLLVSVLPGQTEPAYFLRRAQLVLEQARGEEWTLVDI